MFGRTLSLPAQIIIGITRNSHNQKQPRATFFPLHQSVFEESVNKDMPRYKNYHPVKFIAVLFFLCLLSIGAPLGVFAQLPATGLTIGDTLPNQRINNIINYSNATFDPGSMDKQLVILDFMTTNCIPCIQSLPFYDSLQQRFGNDIQLFLVTGEDNDKVQAFLKKTNTKTPWHLPFITGDTTLHRLFPGDYLPQIVWIRKGVVKGITNSQYLRADNIEKLIRGEEVNWPVKKQSFLENDISLCTLNPKEIDSVKWPSIVYYTGFSKHLTKYVRRGTPYDRGRRSDFKYDSANHTETIMLVNYPIIQLYLKALEQPLNFPVSRMALEVINKQRFIYDKYKDYEDVWQAANTWCYQAVFPEGVADEQRKKELMREDLDAYLGLKAAMEKRIVPTMVLERTNTSDTLLKKHITDNELGESYEESTGVTITLSLSNLLYRLNSSFYSLPFIDETGYTEKRYLQLNEKCFSDTGLLIRGLNKYGLVLRKSIREIEMFVISERVLSANF